MKLPAIFLFPLILILIVNSGFSQCNGTLVWSDEFSGTTLDGNKWVYDIGNGCPSLCGWGNSELEYYTNSTNNVRTADGILTIEARSESMGGSPFTSGKIKTLGKFGHTYGRYEARMRLPNGSGLWPAFWMLNVNNNWPMTGEIDIMEYRGDQTSSTHGTLHYGSAWPNNQYDGGGYNLPTGNFYSEWHLFAVEWDDNEIRWFLDDVKFKTETRNPNSLNPASTDDPWPWTSDFYIILNLAVGGWFTGVTDAADVQLIKATFEIDYVRVYDMQQTPYSGTTQLFPAKIEAEDFDLSCGGGSYSDVDAVNTGGVFRNEQVDIQATTDAGGGYNVAWIEATEWMEYTVQVPNNGTYNFTVRAASGVGGGRLRIEMDGTDVTGAIDITNTGGWQNWQDFMVNNISLTAGTKVMRVYFESGGLNLNYISVTANSLPVEFISLSAERKDKDNILIQWTTGWERNNSHYTVERSFDSQIWEELAEVQGAGNSESINPYYFQDEGFLSEGVFYRIRQTDFDGKETYSPILKVAPASGLLSTMTIDDRIISLSDSRGRIREVRLLESTGKTIMTEPRKEGLELITMKAHDIQPGIYFVYIITDESIEVKKIFLH